MPLKLIAAAKDSWACYLYILVTYKANNNGCEIKFTSYAVYAHKKNLRK